MVIFLVISVTLLLLGCIGYVMVVGAHTELPERIVGLRAWPLHAQVLPPANVQPSVHRGAVPYLSVIRSPVTTCVAHSIHSSTRISP